MSGRPNYTERLVRDREHPYVQVSRELAQDGDLSFTARGLMIYLLSKPDGWVVRMAELDKASPGGRTATRKAFKELLDAGYLTRRFVRYPKGNLEWITMIHEDPVVPIPVNKVPIPITTVDDLPPTTRRTQDTVHGERGSLDISESVTTEEKEDGADAPSHPEPSPSPLPNLEVEKKEPAGKKEPRTVPREGKEKYPYATTVEMRSDLTHYFEEQSGILYPICVKKGDFASARVAWDQPLDAIYVAAGKDMWGAHWLIDAALNKLKDATINCPRSILKTAMSLRGQIPKRPTRSATGGFVAMEPG